MNVRRYYKNEIPDADDIVIVKITKEDEHGYYCYLVEYENLEGFICLSEIVKTKYIKKHIFKIDETVPMIVLKVDPEKRMVDLSKKRLAEKDEPMIMCKYKTCTSINKLVNECYIMYLKYCDIGSSDIIHSINDLMRGTIWKLYEENDKEGEIENYTIIYKDILKNPKIILSTELFDNEFINKAVNNITKRVTINNTVLENNIILFVTEDNALSKIKEILDITGFKHNNDYKISLLVMSPPHYKLRIEGPSFDKINEILGKIKELIQNKANKYSSSCTLKFEEAKVVCESTYDYKFLGDFDLERLELP